MPDSNEKPHIVHIDTILSYLLSEDSPLDIEGNARKKALGKALAGACESCVAEAIKVQASKN